MSAQTKDPPAWVAVPIFGLFCFIVFNAGRCSVEADTQMSFGPVIAPEPIADEYILYPASAGERYSPPDQFWRDVRVAVEFIIPESVGVRCDQPGWALACTIRGGETPLIVMPNPCAFREQDGYALTLCHEISHVNGWDHPSVEDDDFIRYPGDPGYVDPNCRPPKLCATDSERSR